MKTTKKRLVIMLIAGLGLLAIIAAGVWLVLHNNALERARMESMPPQVYITSPFQGETLTADQFIPVMAQASGRKPIVEIELWVNGRLVEIQQSSTAEGDPILYGQFSLLVQEGVNSLFARATDVDGVVGHSIPISFTGNILEGPTYLLIPFTSAHSIEEVALEYDLDPAEIEALNPEAFAGEEPWEGMLRLPTPPEDDEEDEPGDLDPLETGKGALVEGNLCYPSEYIPAMTAYFEETSSHEIVTLPIQEDQLTYQVALPWGTYIAYAWLPDFSLGGAYSKAVPCGLTASCMDHTPLPFAVQPDVPVTGIDICDWYAPSGPPMPPATAGGPAESQIHAAMPAGPVMQAAETYPASNGLALPWALRVPEELTTAPLNLTGGVDGCAVMLSWTHEDPAVQGYAIWLAGQDGSQTLVARLEPADPGFSEHWYEFGAEASGTVSLWVEAYNALGTQASNPVVLTLGKGCEQVDTGALQLELLEIHAPEDVDRAYAYLSIEGAPERRIPTNDGEFVMLSAGRGDLGDSVRGAQKLILPQPPDGELLLEGECWGWRGGDLARLAVFSLSIPQDQWGEMEGWLEGDACEVRFSLSPQQAAGSTLQTFSGDAPGFPAPFNVRSERFYAGTIQEQAWLNWRIIRWDWKGVRGSQPTGFTIMLDHQPVASAARDARSAIIFLPISCGVDITWEVIAKGPHGEQSGSVPLAETLDLCPGYLEFRFDWTYFKCTADGHCKQYCPCKRLETYFYLMVNGYKRSFFGGNFFFPVTCKDQLDYGWLTDGQHSFIFPFPTNPDWPGLSLNAQMKIFDDDTWSKDDLECAFYRSWWFPSYDYYFDLPEEYWYDQENYRPYGHWPEPYGLGVSLEEKYVYPHDLGWAHSQCRSSFTWRLFRP